MDLKVVISTISVLLVFVSYAPYIYDVLRSKTHPHAFTWFIWSLATAITTGLQILGGAGVGSWTIIAISATCWLIFFLSLKYGTPDVTSHDVFFLVLALISLGLWLIAEQPVAAVVLIVTTDILGFGPTVRKSWNNPFSETLLTYEITTARHIVSIFALESYNILTLLYPIAWVAANAAFVAFLMWRRRVVELTPKGY